jgi:hypothetical protein
MRKKENKNYRLFWKTEHPLQYIDVCWLLSKFFLTIPTSYHGKKRKTKSQVFKKNGPMPDAMPSFQGPIDMQIWLDSSLNGRDLRAWMMGDMSNWHADVASKKEVIGSKPLYGGERQPNPERAGGSHRNCLTQQQFLKETSTIVVWHCRRIINCASMETEHLCQMWGFSFFFVCWGEKERFRTQKSTHKAPRDWASNPNNPLREWPKQGDDWSPRAAFVPPDAVPSHSDCLSSHSCPVRLLAPLLLLLLLPPQPGGYLRSLVQFVYRLLPIPYPIPHAPKRRHPTACQLHPRPHSSCRSLTSLSTRDDEKDSDETLNFGNSCSSVSDAARTRMLLPLLLGLVVFSSPGVDTEKWRWGTWLIVGSEPSPSRTVVFVVLSGGLIVSEYGIRLLPLGLCCLPGPPPLPAKLPNPSFLATIATPPCVSFLLAFFFSFLLCNSKSLTRTHTHTNRRILLWKREETKLLNWLWQRCWSFLQKNRSTTTKQAAPTTQPRTPRDPPFFVKLETLRLPRRCFWSTTSASRTALGRRNCWTRTAGVLLLITMRYIWVLESTFHGAPCHGIHKRKPTNTSFSVATSPFKHSNPQKQLQQAQ